MRNKLISLQCVSAFFIFNPAPAAAEEWDYKNIILNKEILELKNSEKAIGIDANNDSSVYLYNTSSTSNTVLSGKSKEYVDDEASTHNTVVQGNGSRQYGYAFAHLYETKLKEGGQQWLNDNALAVGTEVGAGSSMYLSGNSKTIDAVLTDGSQYISGLGAESSGSILYGKSLQQLTGGTADRTELNGSSTQTLQFQSYAPGQVTNTVLNDESIQYVFFEHSTAIASHLNDNSRQYIYFGSQAYDTYINGGHQIVYTDGYAHNTVINDGIQSVAKGAVVNDTTLYGGYTYLYEGSRSTGYMDVSGSGHVYMDHGSYAENINLEQASLFVTDIGDQSPDSMAARIDNLEMTHGMVSFLRDSEGEFTPLDIGNLSGTGLFIFNSSLAEASANFVNIEQGSGQFDIAVSDSGKEIANHDDLTVNLIHDQSGEIDFAMVNANARSTAAIDGGTFMYTLYSAQDKDGLNGGNVWFLGAMTEDQGGGNEGDGNEGDGNEGGGNEGGGNEGGGNEGGGNEGGGNEGGGNEGGGNEGGGNGGDNGGDNGNGGKLVTTPATDAILSLATAGLNVLRSEMDGLRAYRNNQPLSSRQHGEGNVWGHYLGKKSATETSNGAAYKLYQNGFELGGDIITTFERGDLVTGVFVTLSDNKVRHARGGKSKLDSYGVGTYATWYDTRGFYIDGVVKVNRLNSRLNARMTNGGSTSGSWHQYGISSALETGYTFKPTASFYIEPFLRATGTQINDANVKLSNGMKATTGKARSLTAEAGTRIGTELTLGTVEAAPYLRAGIEQEFAKSNETIINNRYRFDNNLNGTSGKYGAGLSVKLAENATLYGEVNYRQGSHVEDPVQGVLGMRIGF